MERNWSDWSILFSPGYRMEKLLEKLAILYIRPYQEMKVIW